ncbi:MAG: metal-sensitive transcriptional regulator [Defluviitaleaceae bacterium]|nr:metal-sensitive transcriptional regulator [Defluviitaleaceae bacterium]
MEKIKKDLVTRLNRIEGQVKGVKSMIERGEYCDDVLTQITAVKSGMNAVAKILLESHMRTCVTEKLQDGDEDVVDEFIKTIGRMLK